MAGENTRGKRDNEISAQSMNPLQGSNGSCLNSFNVPPSLFPFPPFFFHRDFADYSKRMERGGTRSFRSDGRSNCPKRLKN